MRIGICASVEAAGDIAAAGAEFVEEIVQSLLVPGQDEEAFAGKLKPAREAALPVKAANCFLPGAMKCVGPDVDTEGLLRWAETVFRRAKAAGIETIVFGSGGARSVPEGFDRSEAMNQFVDLLKRLGPPAEGNGVTVVVEPLNSQECNFINSLAEGAEAVQRCSHESVWLLADIFHMARDGEEPEEIVRFGSLLRHTHIAEAEKRTPPGKMGDDFRPYFAALKKAGYGGAMTIECSWGDFASESASAVSYLKEQMSEV